MLRELRVENYAVIDNVVVEFGTGLNLLTGETGAGKSILIDALALLLGEKAYSDVVRHGAEKATVAAVYESDDPAIAEVLEGNGIDSAGSEIILRRDISLNGKGRVFINNQPATVAVLKELAPRLAIVHAQNQAILMFDPPERLALLDAAAGVNLGAVAEGYAKWKEVAHRIAALEKGEQEKLRLVDLWKFQLKEIRDAAPAAGEDQKLESEKRVLANSERVYAAALGAFDVLYEVEESAVARLRAATKHLEELSRFDESFKESLAQLEGARITVEDVATTLRDFADGMDASPERLAEVEDRLAVLDKLRRKYGKTLDDVLVFEQEIAGKLSDIENKDELLAGLRKELAMAAAKYLEEARTLSKRRYEMARKLEKTVEGEINDLAMKSKFKIEVSGSDEEGNWSASGFDKVAYLISTNPGEPMAPIEEIASGGELSRVMLALKASVEAGRNQGNSHNKKSDGQRSLVFDEIDTGIGGRAADAVGKKLKALSRTKQVLCITHLPQIASFADRHFLIEKHESGGRTKTTVRPLSAEERRSEIARMLSGAKVTEASLKNAEQLLRANA
ncbi:MAG TPA: DNA repair protein RecN [Candidatus Saccharimonadales bacterium]|nr:DNA repair protein RecN [Candidatus Saccharimonadales bacterium]